VTLTLQHYRQWEHNVTNKPIKKIFPNHRNCCMPFYSVIGNTLFSRSRFTLFHLAPWGGVWLGWAMLPYRSAVDIFHTWANFLSQHLLGRAHIFNVIHCIIHGCPIYCSACWSHLFTSR